MFDKLNSFLDNPNEIYHLNSDMVKAAREEDCILGIDEAGRGPVLGPMVYAAAYYPASMRKDLDNEKFNDSKTLTEKERNDMFEMINTKYSIGWYATVLSPIVISNAMLRRSKYNLNALSHDTAIALIQKSLEDGVQLREVYIDTVGPADKYQAKLKALFPSLKIKVANKADSLYRIVSVASICAKVLRDYVIKHWRFIEDLPYTAEDYGSGYPSDPKTKDFLKKAFDPLFGFPTFVRFSWSTVTKFLEEKGVECNWEDEQEEEEDYTQNSISAFLKPKKSTKWQGKTSSYFTERDIEQIKKLEDVFK